MDYSNLRRIVEERMRDQHRTPAQKRDIFRRNARPITGPQQTEDVLERNRVQTDPSMQVRADYKIVKGAIL